MLLKVSTLMADKASGTSATHAIDSAPKEPLRDTLTSFASSDLAKFKLFFNQTRKVFPREVTEACLWYLAAQHSDSASAMMSRWLGGEGKYFEVLFDSTALPVEAAAKALVALRVSDPHFFTNFISAASALQSPAQILRALNLLPALGDYSALLPLLRTFGRHPDQRVRSKTVKLLCQLRPNKSLIERQMLSTETRVRASAIEALWYVQTPEAREILRSAVADSNHRVVANALVGLHLQHDGSAIETMITLAAHPDALFRTAMAWAFGFILDPRARPTLEHLTQDPSGMVKKRALQSLLALVDLPSQSQEDRLLAEAQSTTPLEPVPSAPQFNVKSGYR